MCECVCVYIYIYREREREREIFNATKLFGHFSQKNAHLLANESTTRVIMVHLSILSPKYFPKIVGILWILLNHWLIDRGRHSPSMDSENTCNVAKKFVHFYLCDLAQ